MKIGQSKDIHQLVEGRKLILGGVEIEYEKGLLGHSDGDALSHAIAEALIGAMGLGDLGRHFPDNDESLRGISSLKILERVKELLKENHYEIINIDSLILIEKPKMAPYIDMMKNNIANALEIDINQINIKATRGEGLGFVGEGKGVEGHAIVLIKEI